LPQMHSAAVDSNPAVMRRSALRQQTLDSFMREPTVPGIGFNRRKMEDQRREAAEKEAANRRTTAAQVLEDAERLIAAWNERQARALCAHDLFADHRRCHQGGLLVLMDQMPSLPNGQCH